ncbi:hypothetical protein BKI52_31120 [marine bacterium AO1-C]|nr:hypothetical protein BKI52_31120 [marine bacterium AO1-C]
MEGLNFNLLNIITLLGSLQGFLLCLLFVSSKRFHRTSTRFLVLLVFSISATNLISSLNDIDLQKIYPIVGLCSNSWSFLIPFSLYYFVQFLLNPTYSFKKTDYIIAMLSSGQLVFQLFEIIWYLLAADEIANYAKTLYVIDRTTETLGLFYCLVVIVLILKKLKNYQRHPSEIQEKSIHWLKKTFIPIGVLWILWAIPLGIQLLTPNPQSGMFYPLKLGMALIIYWLGYSIYIYRDLWETKEESDIELLRKSTKGIELSSKTEEHYQKVLRLFEEEKLYQNAELNMSLLAEKTGLSNGYLSQIINQKEGKNFFDFINYYRVEEVKQKLNDAAFNHYSILGIALEAGFKSKSTFNSAFKKFTGQTPSNFRKQLQNS